MKKFIGFNMQQRGDIIMATALCRAIKVNHAQENPFMILAVSSDYRDMSELLSCCPYVDEVHVWNGRDGSLTKEDIAYARLNSFKLFSPMPRHTSDDWFRRYHQIEEMHHMHSIPLAFSEREKNLQCSLSLETFVRKFPSNPINKLTDKPYICIIPFGGMQKEYKQNSKSFTITNAHKIVELCLKFNIDVFQLGAPFEPLVPGARRVEGLSYLDSVRVMVDAKLIISVDTGLIWVASAFSLPVVGCYSYEYYGKENVSSIYPVNPNARYISAPNVNLVVESEIFKQTLSNLLQEYE